VNDQQLLRYSRQIMLPEVDISGQQRLLDARVLIMGMGGLGSPIAIYLAAAGVGTLVLVDFDDVDLSNLQRQIIHTTATIGISKVASACQQIQALNPDVQVEQINSRLRGSELLEQMKMADVVVDATDNFAARFEINRASVMAATPLVSGAAIRMEGQVSVFNQNQSAPCYRCLYKDEGELDMKCTENGVLAPVVGIIGSIQANEVIKVITGIGETLSGRLLILDAKSMDVRILKLGKDPQCPVCGETEHE